jgi:trans-2,3-dihydro-3-hydroxyanthranilate isomerase
MSLVEKYGFSATRQEAMAYVWARDPRRANSIEVRFFFTSNGALLEDPATGSACANLGGWMIVRATTSSDGARSSDAALGEPRPWTATLSQGSAIERPSRLGLRVDERDQIFVTGSVIELGRGSISL